MVLLQRKLYFSKDPEGVQHFPGGGGGSGVQLLPGGGGGAPMLISIEPISLVIFQGGPDPLSPFWIRTWHMYIPGIWYCMSRERGYVAPVGVNAPVSVNVDNNGRYCSRYC